MKKFATLIVFATSFTANATDAVKTRPTKCLFNQKGVVVSEPCSVKGANPTADITSMCMFDSAAKVWKKGAWRIKKPAKFEYKRTCDQGVEFVTIDTNNMPIGPRRYSTADTNFPVTFNTAASYMKSTFTPTVDPADATAHIVRINELNGKIPTTCFVNQDRATEESSDGKPCESDPQKAGFCELKSLKDKYWLGYFWVSHPDSGMTTYTVCQGGVLMRPLTTDDVSIQRITNTDQSNIVDMDSLTPKFCVLKPTATTEKMLSCNMTTDALGQLGNGSCVKVLPNTVTTTAAYKSALAKVNAKPAKNATAAVIAAYNLAVTDFNTAYGETNYQDDDKHFAYMTITKGVKKYTDCPEMIVSKQRDDDATP